MTLYVCLDDRGGMLFNHRRQSRDGAVLEDLRCSAQGELLIDPFSQKLLEKADIPFRIAPQALGPELAGQHYFLEDRPLGDWLQYVRRVVCYRWNRHYPADRFFDADLAALGFALTQTREFPGTSHETITREVYER